jgi:predicted RNA methylase
MSIKKLLTRENYKYEFSMYDRHAKGKVVVDAGANIGIHSMYLSRFAKTIYAFEPIPQTFAWLKETIHLNARTNIVPVNSALDVNYYALSGKVSSV